MVYEALPYAKVSVVASQGSVDAVDAVASLGDDLSWVFGTGFAYRDCVASCLVTLCCDMRTVADYAQELPSSIIFVARSLANCSFPFTILATDFSVSG